MAKKACFFTHPNNGELMTPWKYAAAAAVVAAFIGLESYAVHAAYQRGYKAAEIKHELARLKREEEIAEWKRNLERQREDDIAAVAASYAASHAEKQTNERKIYADTEKITKPESGIYDRDCMDTYGLHYLNQAIRGSK